MTPEELDAAARALYERNAPIAPSWASLGEATKSTWREAIQRGTSLLFTPARVAHVEELKRTGVPDTVSEPPSAPRVRTRVRT